MKRSAKHIAYGTAVLFSLATQAFAACEDSPRVTSATGQQKDTLLQQCKAANKGMHDTCDNIPSCGAGGYEEATKAKFVHEIQICINKRRAITSTWFDGTSDEGHDTAVDNKINQLNRCLR